MDKLVNAKRILYQGANEEDIRDVRILEKCPSCGHCKIESGNGRVEWVMAHYLTIETDQPAYKTKILRFTRASIPPILSGERDISWRIDDEKNIVGGDILSLKNKDDVEFAKALALWTKNSTLGCLTPEDFKGHAVFESEKELLRTYSIYYQKRLTKNSKVKVIKFKLLSPGG